MDALAAVQGSVHANAAEVVGLVEERPHCLVCELRDAMGELPSLHLAHDRKRAPDFLVRKRAANSCADAAFERAAAMARRSSSPDLSSIEEFAFASSEVEPGAPGQVPVMKLYEYELAGITDETRRL